MALIVPWMRYMFSYVMVVLFVCQPAIAAVSIESLYNTSLLFFITDPTGSLYINTGLNETQLDIVAILKDYLMYKDQNTAMATYLQVKLHISKMIFRRRPAHTT